MKCFESVSFLEQYRISAKANAAKANCWDQLYGTAKAHKFTSIYEKL